MTELDKLAEYLYEIKMPFMQYECNKAYDEKDFIFTLDRHQICVPDQDTPVWDVICQYGSIGYKEGLLEAYGAIVNEEEDGDCVVGYLTADDVIARMKKYRLDDARSMILKMREDYPSKATKMLRALDKKSPMNVDCGWR